VVAELLKSVKTKKKKGDENEITNNRNRNRTTYYRTTNNKILIGILKNNFPPLPVPCCHVPGIHA
jgi:hypothetical protein